MTHESHTPPLGLQSTCCFKNGPWYACWVLWQNKSKKKDHSPSMTLSWLPIQNGLVPQEIAKDTWHYCYHGQYDDPRMSRLTSKHKFVYQMQW